LWWHRGTFDRRAAMSRNLPDFDDPPVVETALGVEFVPLEKWSIPQFGLFWEQIRTEYPRFEIQPPVGSQIERFSAENRPSPPTVTVTAVGVPDVRCWFLERSGSRLLQVQRDRFIHNWRKPPGKAEDYPHYENIRPIFEREWNRFCEFLHRESLGEPDVVQCEVTYVNHLERGKGWSSFGDIANVLTCWTDSEAQFLPKPEGMALNVRYAMPDNQGRLHVSLHPAFRPQDAKEILQLSLTARGRPVSSRINDIVAWLDLGREWVVRGFTDFTSRGMHRVWQRKEDRP